MKFLSYLFKSLEKLGQAYSKQKFEDVLIIKKIDFIEIEAVHLEALKINAF